MLSSQNILKDNYFCYLTCTEWECVVNIDGGTVPSHLNEKQKEREIRRFLVYKYNSHMRPRIRQKDVGIIKLTDAVAFSSASQLSSFKLEGLDLFSI